MNQAIQGKQKLVLEHGGGGGPHSSVSAIHFWLTPGEMLGAMKMLLFAAVILTLVQQCRSEWKLFKYKIITETQLVERIDMKLHVMGK